MTTVKTPYKKMSKELEEALKQLNEMPVDDPRRKDFLSKSVPIEKIVEGKTPNLGEIFKEIAMMKGDVKTKEDSSMKCFDIGDKLDFQSVGELVKKVMPPMPEGKDWDVIIWMSTDGKAIAVILDPYKTWRW